MVFDPPDPTVPRAVPPPPPPRPRRAALPAPSALVPLLPLRVPVLPAAAAPPRAGSAADRTPETGRTHQIRPIAIGLVAVLCMVAWGGWQLSRSGDGQPSKPPGVEETTDAGIPVVVDPRSFPAFDEAYALVCDQTLAAVDRVHAAVGPDLMVVIGAEHVALTQRIEAVYAREDLWAAADPLVLEYAETIADDLASILDGTEVDLVYLDGDVELFRSLCQDWFAPI